MADGFDALFAALDGSGGGGELAVLQRGLEKGAAGIGMHAVLPGDPAHVLSAELGTRAHSAGSHLPQAVRGAQASRGRPRYMAATATQTARALIAALTRAGG